MFASFAFPTNAVQISMSGFNVAHNENIVFTAKYLINSILINSINSKSHGWNPLRAFCRNAFLDIVLI